MKKIFYFFGSFLAMIGGIGSMGYLLWKKEWVIAVGVLVVCFAAYPKIKEWITKLLHE